MNRHRMGMSTFCASCALAVGLAATAAPGLARAGEAATAEQQVAQSGSGAPPASAPAEMDASDTVIITGTRVGGTKAIESSAPIEILPPAALENSGEQNLLEAMVDIAPSFSAVSSTDYGASDRFRGRAEGHSGSQRFVFTSWPGVSHRWHRVGCQGGESDERRAAAVHASERRYCP